MKYTALRKPLRLLALCVAALLLALSLAGCSKDKPEEVVLNVTDIMDTVKSGDYTDVAFLFDSTPDQMARDSLYAVALQNITYVVGNVVVDGRSASATVAVYTVDMANLMLRYTLAYLEGEENRATFGVSTFVPETWLRNTLSDTANLRFVQNSATVYLTRANGAWVLDRSADHTAFADAISGGLLSWSRNAGALFEQMS